MKRRTAARLGAVGLVVATLLAAVSGTAAAAPAQPCVLGVICSPDDPTPTPSPTPAPSTPPSSARDGASPTPTTTAPPTSSAPGGLLPGLPLPTDALPLPTDALPTLPLDGVLPPGLLPNLITPVLPQVESDNGFVSPGFVGDLTMDRLDVTNFRFVGVVNHPTADGGTIQALRIIVDTTDIQNLGVFAPGVTGSLTTIQVPGSANATSGQLVLDFTELYLVLFGVLPITFSAALPPPPGLVIPYLFGTDVDIDFVQVATTLTIPGLLATAGPAAGPNVGTGPGSAATPLSVETLVAVAQLLGLPSFLLPYGFTQEQADEAVANGQPAQGGAPPGGLLAGPSTGPPDPSASPPSSSGPQPADGSAAPPLTGLADILAG